MINVIDGKNVFLQNGKILTCYDSTPFQNSPFWIFLNLGPTMGGSLNMLLILMHISYTFYFTE